MKRTKRLNQLGLGIIIMVYFLLLAGSRFHIIPANIHVVPLFACILIAITIILGFIIVPSSEKKLFLPKGIGYGWTLNPRNAFGLLIYVALLVLALTAIF